jgi:methyl-accepting chemotaxis protein
VTTLTPARPGPGVARRRSSDDLSISGPLFPRLVLTGAAGILLHGMFTSHGRAVELAVGALALAVAAIGSRVNWEGVASGTARALPLLGVGLTAFLGLASVDALMPMNLALALTVVWTGLALELADLIVVSVLLTAVQVGALWHFGGAATAVSQATAASVLLVGLGASVRWLRGQYDLTQDRVSGAQQVAADAAVAAERTREQQESERAELTRAELGRRADLQQQVMAEVSTLAGAASGVSSQAGAVSAAVDEMSHALQELTRTAQVSDQISETVAAKAREASEVMAALAESSAQIMAASDVIQGIAEQTNLLALNATIESARAGEAGRGFAVVANEVKDLARQSGDNADTITRTLAEVRSQVDAAVSRVAEISASMDELNRQNGALASAIEEQSAVVQQIAESVGSTATEADRMAEGVRSLERIAGT